MQPTGHLPRRVKLGYAATDLGLAAVETLLQIYLLKFYNTTVGLPAIYTGSALAIAMIWDAVSDPIMGSISDRTQHLKGRRRPYIFPGACALALFFILIFNPPASSTIPFQFAFLLITYMLINTAMTVVAVPHAALGAELSFDRNERTEIFGYKRLFDTFGALLGLTLPAIILALLNQSNTPETVERARNLMGFVLAVPITITAWITVQTTTGRDHSRPVIAKHSIKNQLLRQFEAIKNPVFWPLLLAFVIISVGRAINASVALYYYEYRLGFSETTTIGQILLPFFIAFLLSIPLWIYVSRKWGKKWPATIGVFALGLTTSIVYPLFPPGQILWPILYALPGGIFVGAIILLDSLVTDAIDYDELKTGQNREGLYFGMWKMATKIARASGLVLAGFLLDSIGFVETATEQTPQVTWYLSLIFGPTTGLIFMTGGIILTCFPLTDTRHKHIQRLLLKRRRIEIQATASSAPQ